MRRRQPQRKAPQFSSGNSAMTSRDMGRSTASLADPSTTAAANRFSTELDRPLCRFYVLHKGNCRHGKDCAYSHNLPEGVSWEQAKQLVPCPFFGQGNCRYGEHCQLRHDPQDLVMNAMNHGGGPSCAVASVPTTDSRGDKRKDDDIVVCGICLNKKT